MSKTSQRISAAVMGAAGAGMLALAGVGTVGAAAATCDIADFTTGSTVDMDGYLACLAGAGGGDTPGLPSTGTDVAQYVGLGAGLIAVGVAAYLVARQRRTAEI